MTSTDLPPIKLSVLRDIGWREWDPIGILPAGEAWDDQPFADEYDRYLVAVASGFRRGMSLEEGIQCLLRAARQQMGLSPHPLKIEQASATARLIQRYIAELDRRSPASA